MKGNIIETIIGAFVLIVALSFVVYAYGIAGTSPQSGYEVKADFNKVDGLSTGADVRLSGIKIGTITAMTLDPESYRAKIIMTINADVKLYEGTTAKITSAGFLGNSYISLDPGGGFDAITDGGEIVHTMGSVDLIELISKFIFSGGGGGQDDDNGKKK